MTPLAAELARTALPPGWYPLASAQQKQALVDELRRELPRGHALSDRGVEAVAHRRDRDDVLYVAHDPPCLAEVHLTWNRESNKVWPQTTLFSSVPEWIAAADSDDK